MKNGCWVLSVLVVMGCAVEKKVGGDDDTTTVLQDDPPETDRTFEDDVCAAPACGGELAGVWELSTECGTVSGYDRSSQFTTSLTFGTPEGLDEVMCPASVEIDRSRGYTMSFDGYYDLVNMGAYSTGGSWAFDAACVQGSGQTCDGIEAWYEEEFYTQQTSIPNTPGATYFYEFDAFDISCEETDAGGCACEFGQGFDYGLSYPYEVDGNILTIADVDYEFCVVGDQMWYGERNALRQSASRL